MIWHFLLLSINSISNPFSLCSSFFLFLSFYGVFLLYYLYLLFLNQIPSFFFFSCRAKLDMAVYKEYKKYINKNKYIKIYAFQSGGRGYPLSLHFLEYRLHGSAVNGMPVPAFKNLTGTYHMSGCLEVAPEARGSGSALSATSPFLSHSNTALNPSCFPPVLHPSCPASHLSCVPTVLHPSCPASHLSCIPPVLHPTCHASHLSCIPPVLYPTCPSSHPYSTCPCIGISSLAFHLSCIPPILYSTYPV